MAIIIKTKEEIEILREGGRRLAGVLHKVKERIKPGISTKDLDRYAQELIKDLGDEPAFLNYIPEGVSKPFPAALCVSVNEEVVHGIPKENLILKEGDIVSIDCGLKYQGLYTDMAMTVPVGKVSSEVKKLVETTRRALEAGIDTFIPGNTLGDVGHVIAEFARDEGYGIVEELSGHGVGREIHEDPYIPNFGRPGEGEKIVPDMVVAIEPMFNLGTKRVKFENDQYTVRTLDRKPSAHFEHTVLVTEKGSEILTKV